MTIQAMYLCKGYFRPYLHVFDPIWTLGQGGGSPKGLAHNVLMQLFTLGKLKNRSFSKLFFGILTI